MTSRPDLATRLASVPLLAPLSDDARKRLTMRADPVKVQRGALVVQHQEVSDDVYFVLSGELTAILISGRGREFALGEIKAGQYFGEIAAFSDGERSATIYARTDAELVRVPGKAFRTLVEQEPNVARTLIVDMVGRIRQLTQRSFELTAFKLADRLALFLLRAGLEAGVFEAGGELKPAPTHANIAARVGANREAVSRELSALGQQGVIATRRAAITFLDPEALLALARDADEA